MVVVGRALWPRLCPWLCILALTLLAVACSGEEQAEAPGGEGVIFREEFSDTTSATWNLEEDDLGRAAISEGRLLLSMSAPNTVHYATLEERSFSDFILEVDVVQLSGSPASSYGVLIRMAGPRQFYRFEITGNGEFTVERHDGEGAWVRLTDGWVPSQHIQQGLDVTNHLTIIAAGGTFSFYANDQLLSQLLDRSYPSGNIALDAGTFGQTDLQVAFDNLIVREP